METRVARLPLETRIVALLIAAVLFWAFFILYLHSGQTKEMFAWNIQPPMTAMFMGAGYLAGAVFFAEVFFAARWTSVAAMFVGVALFAVFMAFATLLHWDRFRHSHVTTVLWVAVYAVTPFVIPYLFVRNRRLLSDWPPGSAVLVPEAVRSLFALMYSFYAVLGLVAFIHPPFLIGLWPWKLTPLTARIVAGWLAFHGAGGLAMTVHRQWSWWKITIRIAMLWFVLLLVAYFFCRASFASEGVRQWGFPVLLALSLGVYGFLYAAMEAKA